MGHSFFFTLNALMTKKRSKRETDGFRDRGTVLWDGAEQYGRRPSREVPTSAETLKIAAKGASRAIGKESGNEVHCDQAGRDDDRKHRS